LEEETKRIRKMVEQSENPEPAGPMNSILYWRRPERRKGRTIEQPTLVYHESKLETVGGSWRPTVIGTTFCVISENEADAIKFAGPGLRSLEETAAWVESHFP
jgi:hypothetical protein